MSTLQYVVQGPQPHFRKTITHFLPTLETRRRAAPRDAAPDLCQAESKYTSTSKSSPGTCTADIGRHAVACPASRRGGAIHVLFTRLGPSHGSTVEARCLTLTLLIKKQYCFGGGASGRPAVDAPHCSRLRTLRIFDRNGALATTRCPFSSQANSWASAGVN